MELCDKNDEFMMHASCMLYANTGRGASFFMCAEEKGKRRVQRKREQGGKWRQAFLSCLLVICMFVVFTDNAAKTVKATEVASAEAAEMGSGAAEPTVTETVTDSEAEQETTVVGAEDVSTRTEQETMKDSEAEQETVTEKDEAGQETATEKGEAEQETAAEKGEAEQEAATAQETVQTTDADTKIMYLTFDDGPSAESTEQILDILKEHNIKATFFVIGENVRKHPETARRIVEEGHTIGIHCDVHDYDMLYESADSYVADFEKAYDTVLSVTGVRAKIFRFPGGSINAYNKGVYKDIIAAMEARGFVYFDWNASVEDAAGGKPTPEELVQNARDTSLGRKRVILLAHDRIGNTALALDALIDAFSEYEMEPLTAETAPIQF